MIVGSLVLASVAAGPGSGSSIAHAQERPTQSRHQSPKIRTEMPSNSSLAQKTTPSSVTPMEQSLEGKTIGEIQVQGLKRIEKDAVLAKISSKIGQPVSPEMIRKDIQSVYDMGYFDDITVEGEQLPNGTVRLIYVARERPVISKIEFVGNERISSSDLKDVIKVKEWSILDINKVKNDVNLIQKHYEDKGYYLAKVTFSVRQTGADEVQLSYRINDYDKVQIKKIIFLNNRKFSDAQLKTVLQDTREGGFFSFLTSSGNFKESAFRQDLQRLTYWYLDHGYIKFRYENPVVTVSDDKRWLYISIYVDEGEQYKVGNVDFSGDLLFSKEELHSKLSLNEGDTFSISKRNTDIQKLTEMYQDLGYAFVNVVPNMPPASIHEDSKTVDINYSFEKGNLVYFGEINITGNTKTHDKVIRRELKIHEGELYNGTNLRVSRENVERLGYFSPGEVVFNTVSPKGQPDVLNVDISVKERSTGTITLGAGYGSIQKFFLTAAISEINLLGRGQSITLSGQYAADTYSKAVNLGFTDPYSFDTLWSLGGDLYALTLPIPNLYSTQKVGFDVRAGYPVAEFIYTYLTYKMEAMNVLYNVQIPGMDIPPPDPLVYTVGAGDKGYLSSVTLSVVRDKRNNRFETTDGDYQSASLEVAGLGGTKDFTKWDLNNRYYKHVVGDLVFRNNIETALINGFNGKEIPPSEKFFLGGPNNMRGFEFFALAPYEIGTTGAVVPLGGAYQAYMMSEFEYPIIKEAGLKAVVFYDLGNSWLTVPAINDLTIRSDWGFGVRWFSPIGPLRFEWGFPFAPRPGESTSVFQFFIGPPF